MSVENGKVCYNCRHCIRERDEETLFTRCHCEVDGKYMPHINVMVRWCRHWSHWAKEKDGNGAVPMRLVRKAFDKLVQPEASCYLGSPCEYQNPNAEIQEECKLDGTTAVAKSKRTFVELLVHYPHPDVCTYPEYKGKPYYSIKYIEDGECFVGFGTYKPEVLSQYLRDYFMPPAQPEERTEKRTETRACDLIRQQDAVELAMKYCSDDDGTVQCDGDIRELLDELEDLPPAQPEQKWIPCGETVDIPDHEIMACDRYGEFIIGYLDCKDEQWICESDNSVMYDPVAWCELPKPYKEGGVDAR